MNSPLSGAFLETYAISEIIKSYRHNGKEAVFSFYRDKRQKEIDFLIERDGLVMPVEIKTTSNPTVALAVGFNEIPEEKRGQGAILCTATESYPLGKDLYAIPIGLI